MPTDSKREQILQNVLATLGAIAEGADYFTSPKTVSREFYPVDERPPTEFPILFINAGDETPRVGDRVTRLSHLKIEVRGFIRREAGPASGGKTLSQSLNELMVDCEKALAVDETRGGLAGQTDVVSIDADEVSVLDLGGFLIMFDIFYAARRFQP